MKSCVSVMKLITNVIKKFITEGVNSCQMKGRFFGCIPVDGRLSAQECRNCTLARGIWPNMGISYLYYKFSYYEASS